jgi:hypothetical protein
MEKRFSSILGVGLALLTVSGFAKRTLPKRFLGLMNVDTQHSVLRVPLTLALLHAGSSRTTLRHTRSVLTFVGTFYIAMGVAGSLDKSVGGTLPSRLTNFDVVYHFGVGAIALWLGGRSGRMVKS